MDHAGGRTPTAYLDNDPNAVWPRYAGFTGDAGNAYLLVAGERVAAGTPNVAVFAREGGALTKVGALPGPPGCQWVGTFQAPGFVSLAGVRWSAAGVAAAVAAVVLAIWRGR